eukprot:Skav214103  [mRNA]  locus=scaffold1185:212429:214697:+ [translate_table: standard]
MVIQRINDPVIAQDLGLFDDRCDEIRGIDDEPGGFSLSSLDVFSQGVVALRQGAIGTFLFLLFSLAQLDFFLFIEILQANLLNVEKLQEAAFHLVFISKGEVAKNQIEAGHKIQVLGSMHQQILI